MVKLVRWALILGLVGVGMVGSWALLHTAFEATADYDFCTGCHSYEPIAAAYREDVHGGNNPQGLRAACNDCHLPHDNALHYFFVKARHGVVDPIASLVKSPEDIDWHGIRERRESFVYDSGCLGCHKNLETATVENRMAARSHKRYFKDPEAKNCVGCHENVGHHQLGDHLEAAGWPKPAGKGG